MAPIDIAPDPAPARSAASVVAVSAPAQLCSVMCACDSTKPPKHPIPQALQARTNRFWDDGWSSLTEIVVLADACGCLDEDRIEPFLERLLAPVDIAIRPPLETEPPDERDVVHARLDRLASDRTLRRRYVALLRDLWAVVAPDWEQGGRERATQAATAWAERLAAGADPLEFLPEQHIARREPFDIMTREAHRSGRLHLAPLAVGYGHIVALPQLLSVAAPATATDPIVARRRTASEVADRLKPLSDPTRLTMLVQLAHGPLGVGELAAALHIAQPTASVHLRQLRDVGLVEATRVGTKTVYSVRSGAVDRILHEAADRLGQSMGDRA